MPVDIDALRTRCAEQPDNKLFRFSLGQAAHNVGLHEEAVEHLGRCVDLQPDWMLAHILLGKSLLALGRPEEAKPVLEEALRLAVEQKHEGPEEDVREILSDL